MINSMRRFIIISAALVMQSTQAEQWVPYLGMEKYMGNVFYIDIDSIRKVKENSAVVYAKTKTEYKEPSKDGTLGWRDEIIISCGGISKLINRTVYATNGLIIQQRSIRSLNEAIDDSLSNTSTESEQLRNMESVKAEICPVIYKTLGNPNFAAAPIRKESNSGDSIKLTRAGGVYHIPVEINGLIDASFVIDSGAADVALSRSLYLKLVDVGAIRKADLLGEASYRLADGSETKNMVINLKSIKIGTIEIRNVRASVSRENNSPLLLGQSALRRFRSWRLSGDRLEVEANE